jgi:hypothetical protein
LQIDGIAGRIWPAVTETTEWQRIGNQIDAAFIFARANLVDERNALQLP